MKCVVEDKKNASRITSGCNSTQSAKSASALDSSALRGRSLNATRTLPGTVKPKN